MKFLNHTPSDTAEEMRDERRRITVDAPETSTQMMIAIRNGGPFDSSDVENVKYYVTYLQKRGLIVSDSIEYKEDGSVTFDLKEKGKHVAKMMERYQDQKMRM